MVFRFRKTNGIDPERLSLASVLHPKVLGFRWLSNPGFAIKHRNPSALRRVIVPAMFGEDPDRNLL